MDKIEVIIMSLIILSGISTICFIAYNLGNNDKYVGELTCDNFKEYYIKCLEIYPKESCQRTIQLKNEECINDLEFEKILKRSEK